MLPADSSTFICADNPNGAAMSNSAGTNGHRSPTRCTSGFRLNPTGFLQETHDKVQETLQNVEEPQR
jgi:hypothetical protein